MKKSRHSITIKAVLLSAVLCLVTSCNETPDSSSTSVHVTPQVVASASLETPEIEQHDINALTGLAPIEGQAEGTRPVAVMVENIDKAMPLTGISSADVVYETETELGLTSYMLVYSDINSMVAVGPVSSLRAQFAELAMAQNAILVNIDTNMYADNLLNYFGYQNIDGIYLGTTAFNFDLPRSYDYGNIYSWYTSSTLVSTGISINSISPVGGYYPLFNFSAVDEEINDDFEGIASSSINFNFSDSATGELRYNGTTESYDKYFAGSPQLDSIEQKQLTFDNVFLLFCDVSMQADNYSTNFALTQGEGYYVNKGKYSEISWQKGNPDDQLKILNQDGEEILVNPGKSYIAFISNSYKETLVIS